MNNHQRLLYRIAETSYKAILANAGGWFNSFDRHYQIIKRAYGGETNEKLRQSLEYYKHCKEFVNKIRGLEN